MSEAEYKELVLAEYDRLIAAEKLPIELRAPKRKTIKAEVVKFLEQNATLSSGDEFILRSFVGEKTDVAAYHKAYKLVSADTFRQVVTLLAKRELNPGMKYINLLALLIGFPSRPYNPHMRPAVKLQETEVISDPLVKVEPPVMPPGPPEMTAPPTETVPIEGIVQADGTKPLEGTVPTEETVPSDQTINSSRTAKNKRYQLLWFFVPVFVISLGWYAKSKRLFHHYSGHERFMVWVDDHYEPIDSNDFWTTAPHYPIKHELVDHFQLINRPDTLTYQSVKKVWYSNYKGRVQFYTDSGPNPLDTNYRVLPMTTGILEKYVLHIRN